MVKLLSMFIDYTGEIAALAHHVESVLGQTPKMEQRDAGIVYSFEVLDIELLLFDDHGLIDDQGIPFSSYKYELDLRVLDRSSGIFEIFPMYENIARFLSAKISDLLGCRTMLISNLQRKVVSFSSGVNTE